MYAVTVYTHSLPQASVYKPDLSPMMDIEMVLMSIELVYLWSALPMTSEATKLKMLEMLHKATSPNGLPFHHGLRDLLMGCVLKSLNRIPEAEKVCGYVILPLTCELGCCLQSSGTQVL